MKKLLAALSLVAAIGIGAAVTEGYNVVPEDGVRFFFAVVGCLSATLVVILGSAWVCEKVFD